MNQLQSPPSFMREIARLSGSALKSPVITKFIVTRQFPDHSQQHAGTHHPG
jgi:hypothetical protein